MTATLRTLLATCLAAIALAGPAGAEAGPSSGGAWTLDEALGLPERLSLEGDFRIRYEYLDNQFRAGRSGSDEVLPLRTRVRARFRFTDWLEAAAEFQDSRSYLDDSSTPVNTSLVNAAELLEAYLRLSFTGKWGAHHSVRGGRWTLDLGSRRLMARNRYRNTSNAFTGVDWLVRGEKDRSLRVFYSLPVERLPREVAKLRDNRVEFDDETSDFHFFGIYYTDESLPWGDLGEAYIFGLYEDAVFNTEGGINTPRRQLGTPGFRLLRAPRRGRFDYQVETALQFGRSGSADSDFADRNHFAHFHHVTVGYTFDLPGSPRVLVHYDYASGDDDPDDGSNDRFDSLFGARRWEYGPTSIYGPWSRSNINTPGVRLELNDRPHWDAFVDYRAVWLSSDRDEWVGTGVRDPTGRSGSFVGQQVELRLRYRPFPGNVVLEAGYAHLFAGEFIDDAPNSNGGDTNYVYTQLRLEF